MLIAHTSPKHTLFSFVRGFLLEKYVTNGLWINKKPNWIRLSCKVIVKSLKAPAFYSDFRIFWTSGFLLPVAYNASFVVIFQQWFRLWDVLGVIYLPKQSH